MAENECIEILKNGIYETHITTRTENRDVDYKHYFASDEFKSDFQNGKFSLGVEAIIDSVPLKLDYGSDETQISKFQKKVREATTFKTSNNFFLQSAESASNKDIINAYKECLKNQGFGFHTSYETTETTITFRVFYRNLDMAQKPKLQDIVITPQSQLVFQSVKKGEEILNNSESKFVFELAKETKEVVFILDTDLTAVSEKAQIERKGTGSSSLPIGTIIASYLDWNQFQKTTENNKNSGGIWKSEFSYWSPCDGREVPNSDFQNLTSRNNVPDLRGLFLRGLNTFDFSETSVVDPFHADPDTNRKVGSFQIDDFKRHSHPIYASVNTAQIRGSGGAAGDYPVNSATGEMGGLETRPKNMATFFYIKIN